MLRKSIPNILTMCSLLSGITALFFVFNADFESAMMAILVASFFDFVDGFAARLLKATSDFGVELDSLSDNVSFGVVPAVASTVFSASLIGVHNIEQFTMIKPVDMGFIALPMLIAVASALRLARFNIDENQSSNFIGLPTPANTLFIMAFLLFVKTQGAILFDQMPLLKGIMAVVFVLSAFMLVSPVNLFALKFKSFALGLNWYRYLLLMVGLTAIILWGMTSFVIIIPFYIILSVFLTLFRKLDRS